MPPRAGFSGRDRVGVGGWREAGEFGGKRPRLSGDQTRQSAEEDGENRLVGGARRQGILSWVLSSSTRAAILIKRSRKVSNCMTRQVERLGMIRRIDHKSQ